jgi:pimeloyl-ACP methyl ester carboxylesterase
MELAPEHVTGFISVAPAPHANVIEPKAFVPPTQPITFDESAVRKFFCNAPRFPIGYIDQYRRSLCSMSPGVFNAVGSGKDILELFIGDFSAIARIPKVVIAGDHDQLVSFQVSLAIAESLGAQHVTVGRDWGLFGFGHMIPIESGSEAILGRCLEWLANAAPAPVLS